jgi:hypothetical protein
VIFGSTDLEATLDLAVGSHDLALYGAEAGDHFGSAVGMGDLNGDGREEMIVVASESDGPENARLSAGEIYVIETAGATQ